MATEGFQSFKVGPGTLGDGITARLERQEEPDGPLLASGLEIETVRVGIFVNEKKGWWHRITKISAVDHSKHQKTEGEDCIGKYVFVAETPKKERLDPLGSTPKIKALF